jgi:hypothetical protein
MIDVEIKRECPTNVNEEIGIDEKSCILSDHSIANITDPQDYLKVQKNLNHIFMLMKNIIALAHYNQKKEFHEIKERLERRFKGFLEYHTEVVERENDDAEDKTSNSCN